MISLVVMSVISVSAVAFMIRFLIALNREPHSECHIVHVARPLGDTAANARGIRPSRAYLYQDPERAQHAVIARVGRTAPTAIYRTERQA